MMEKSAVVYPTLNQDEALRALDKGGCILMPLGGAYVLSCDAINAEAVRRISQLKGRPFGQPLPLLFSSLSEVRNAQVETPLLSLADAFWPGPLTLSVPAFPGLPASVTQGIHMVGIRVPTSAAVRQLISALGRPLVATSANPSGQPAALSLEDCVRYRFSGLTGRLDIPLGTRERSTVVALAEGRLRFHREGRYTRREIEAAWLRCRMTH